MSFWDALDPKYRLILCDVWGVVHDGVNLYPGASERLTQWREQGRCVILLTNAPRTAEAVDQQLVRIGLPCAAYDFVATSGEAGIETLVGLDRPVGFIGTAGDREILEGRGVRIADGEDFTDLACTGVTEQRPRAEDYRADLERWADRDVHMHCLNPDRLVIRGGVPEACAGAIADLYAMLGGRVTWYGKPHDTIYRHALHLAGNPPKDEVLAVGDGLQTDVLGAARMGFDTVFVTGGIHAGEPFPENFAAENGLGDWEPVAVVDGLA
ncbi:TIGR01459 family HAD-type hydrolase [Sphingomonas limnosediminicola]|jgi:HAD superfamily hydrolase (TIGR01459 family)|uniref:TIGR01459 family HAD-type hydrolase n=1 Tax=Sphingomonas limnosediminicola TaxID=940133 RepID=A0ABP7KUM2_9SPHN